MPKPVKLTNRGGFGLHDRLPADAQRQEPAKVDTQVDYIIGSLRQFATDITTLIYDPLNARIHPERNLESIRQSLCLYGQRTPLVVNSRTMHVEKGNGTLEAARSLNWTQIAAIFVDDDEATAAGYGLADNRSAELAKWHVENIAKIDTLITQCGGPQARPGWSVDEMEVLRSANFEWVPPAIDGNGEHKVGPLKVEFSPELRCIIDKAVSRYRDEVGDDKRSEADCIARICQHWLKMLNQLVEQETF